ncbi:hypothetical protein HK100_012653 [Physocladia obscura]|uniref:Uncharacterized protein n=1 Tax=Physocladia obscura TaxID=109957 RepID=A0AAD5T166_9FUNG|nr:hypothetical protein HK100_012653 [Physocladia obscura]
MASPTQNNGFPPYKIALWGTAGLFLNSWARSMARLPLRANPISYIAWTAASLSVGYGIHTFEVSRFAEMEIEKDRLVKRRMLALEAKDEQ